MYILDKIFGTESDRTIAKSKTVVDKTALFEASFEALTNDKSASKLKSLKSNRQWSKLDEIMSEAFALVREAAKRTLNQNTTMCKLSAE